MVLSIVRWVKGYLRIRAEGYSPERFLNACRYRGIDLWGLKSAGGAYEMYISLWRKTYAFAMTIPDDIPIPHRSDIYES